MTHEALAGALDSRIGTLIRAGETVYYVMLDGEYWERPTLEGINRVLALLPPATEPTDQGLQYVMPGCAKDQSRGPAQMSLF